jgi:hypothetical protein
MVSAPWTPTDFPAAAAWAWFTALSMPSVMKWTVELGRGHPPGITVAARCRKRTAGSRTAQS